MATLLNGLQLDLFIVVDPQIRRLQLARIIQPRVDVLSPWTGGSRQIAALLAIVYAAVAAGFFLIFAVHSEERKEENADDNKD